jgi:hypothetical protein
MCTTICLPRLGRPQASGEINYDSSSVCAPRTEVDIVARRWYAVSMRTTLNDTLMSFHSSLAPTMLGGRSSLVLHRMRKILPHELTEDLRIYVAIHGLGRSSRKRMLRTVRRCVFALPAARLISFPSVSSAPLRPFTTC